MTLSILVRQRIRRDRLQLLIWILGIGLLVVASVTAEVKSYPSTDDRQSLLSLAVANPALLMLRGLPAGTTEGGLTFFQLFTSLAVLVGLMSTFLAIRHSRAEEESGRAELIAATPASRILPTLATVIHGVLANLVLGIAVALSFLMVGDIQSSAITGLAVAGVGIVFIGAGLVAAQVMRSSRGANGLAAALVGGAYLLRGIGDALGTISNNGLTVTSAWPSWLSPIGWGQQSQPFTAPTFLPLLLQLFVAVVLIGAVLVLQSTRDSGASLLAVRAGRTTAARRLSGSVGLAWRLQWPTILGWSLGAGVLGILAGSLGPVVATTVAADPAIIAALEQLAPANNGTILQSFLSAIFGMVGVLAAACAVQMIIRMRQEEAGGTAELLLAASVSRMRWLIGYLVVGIAAIVLVLIASATASGLTSMVSTPSTNLFADSFVSALAQLPVALLYLTVLALVFTLVSPGTASIGWSTLAVGAFLGLYGGLLGLPNWVRDLSPFSHSPTLIGGTSDWSGGLWMLGIAAAAAIVASASMRRHELAG